MKDKMFRGFSAVAVLFAAMMVWGSPAWAETFTVKSTDDSGPGSLREAIDKANDETTNPGEDRILFDPSLTANGDATIELSTAGDDDDYGGSSALLASSRISIEGPSGENGVTIARSADAPEMRLFYASGSSGLSLSNLTLENGKSNYGGAVFMDYGATAWFADSIVKGSTATFDGGAIYNYAATLTLTDSIVSGNNAFQTGGGILNNGGVVDVSGTTVSRNTADSPDGSAEAKGGGIHNYYGYMRLAGSTVSGDTATVGGGGVFNYGGGSTLELTGTTVSGNAAEGGDGGTLHGGGGGILNDGGGTATLTNSTLDSNTTTGSGGALMNQRGAATELANATVSGNAARNAGGGILNIDDGSTLTLSSSTVTANTARDGTGSGIYAHGGSEEFGNTIIAGNKSPDPGRTVEVNGDYTEGGPNLISVDPKLGPLTNSDGPTKTHAPQVGSPAIDRGETDLTVDQRGFVRPADGDGNGSSTDDVGASEKDARQPAPGTLRFEEESVATTAEEDGTIEVVRTGGSEGTVEVEYTTSDGTATAGSDYTEAYYDNLTFADGETRKSFPIPVANDSLDERDETVNLRLSAPQGGATLGTPSKATLTITDDDDPPSLSISDAAAVAEGDPGATTNYAFVVKLSAASGKTVTVDYATADGTATAGSDYAETSGTLTFEPGQTTQGANVRVNGDAEIEPDETFAVRLEAPENAALSGGRATATITNDDEPPDADAPVITGPADDSYDTDGSITISGTAEKSSIVELLEGTTSKGKATADPSGNWSVALESVTDGKHSYTATATDKTGNASPASAPRTVTVDTVKPSVSAVSPAGGATRVAASANATATFSEAMDPDTITTSTVKLVRSGTTTAIPATVTYDPATRKATLNPSASLKAGARYTATVTADAKDAAGNPLEAAKTWSFTVKKRR